MIVVSVAMVGSLTVLPALLASSATASSGDRIPFLRTGKPRLAARAAWSAILRPVLRHPALSAVLSAGFLVVLAFPAFAHAHEAPELHRPAAARSRSCRPTTRSSRHFPGSPVPAVVVGQRQRRERAAQCSGRPRPPRPRSGDRGDDPADRTSAVNPSHTVGAVTIPLAGDRQPQSDCLRRAQTLRTAGHPGDDRAPCPASRSRSRGETAGNRDFNDTMQHAAAARLRLRARARVPAAAAHVPLDRDPDQGDRAQPALGRGRLRRARAGSSRRPPQGCSASARTAASSPGCRSSCSCSCSGSRWTTTCSSSAASRSWSTAGCDTDEAVEQGIRTTAGTVTSAAS